MADVTKSCVRMLKFERAIRKIIKFPFVLIIDVIERLVGWINWCVVRSVMRLFGFPLFIICCILMYNTFIKYGWYGKFSTIDSVLTVIELISSALLLCITVYSWVEVPDREQEILDGKYD